MVRARGSARAKSSGRLPALGKRKPSSHLNSAHAINYAVLIPALHLFHFVTSHSFSSEYVYLNVVEMFQITSAPPSHGALTTNKLPMSNIQGVPIYTWCRQEQLMQDVSHPVCQKMADGYSSLLPTQPWLPVIIGAKYGYKAVVLHLNLHS